MSQDLKTGFMGCAICGKPLRLAEAKSENGGLPVHEECYYLKVKQASLPIDSKSRGNSSPALRTPS